LRNIVRSRHDHEVEQAVENTLQNATRLTKRNFLTENDWEVKVNAFIAVTAVLELKANEIGY